MKFTIKNLIMLGAVAALAITSSCKEDEPEPQNQAPVFENTEFTIAENFTPGETIGALNATDPENDELTFSITSGNSDNLFELSENDLLLSASGSLDFETATKYVLTIEVSDGELSASASVTVNVSDIAENAAPVIEEEFFRITDYAKNGDEVGTVTATDESAITFNIISGNDDGFFTIDNVGKITVAKDNPEGDKTYALEVEASDGELVSSATVEIKVAESHGSFTVEGEEFPLTVGTITDYGAYDPIEDFSHYNYDFVTADAEFDPDDLEGEPEIANSYIYIELFSAGTDAFSPGEFVFMDENTTTQEDINGKSFFFYGALGIDANGNQKLFNTEEDEEEDILYFITGGSVTVAEESGDNAYTITYNLEVRQADYNTEEFIGEVVTLTGSYSHEFLDTDDAGRSAKSSQKNTLLKKK